MLEGMVALLFITFQQATILEFETPVEYYAVDMKSYLSKNKKILLIHPARKDFDEFLVAITKKGTYQLRFKSTKEKGNALYKIREGFKERLYRLKITTSRYKVLEGRTSLKIIRLKGEYLSLNGQKYTRRILFYPRNAHLVINGKRIY